MSDEAERLQRRIERERASRKQAERLLEEKSLELFNANQALQASTSSLEKQVHLIIPDLAPLFVHRFGRVGDTQLLSRRYCNYIISAAI